jgi:hypothetical protein
MYVQCQHLSPIGMLCTVCVLVSYLLPNNASQAGNAVCNYTQIGLKLLKHPRLSMIRYIHTIPHREVGQSRIRDTPKSQHKVNNNSITEMA